MLLNPPYDILHNEVYCEMDSIFSKEYFEKSIEWLEKSIERLQQYFEKILEEKDKALIAALTAVKEENKKTEAAAEERFKLLNELRGDVATKTEVKALSKVVDDLKTEFNKVRDTAAGKSSGLSLGWKILIGILSLISMLLGLLVTYNSLRR